ncbi:MAG TPA: ATP synthase F1 subunit epsilon [Nitrospiria bacterium]|nr:ATP synthase F1 subunit epsilon [Nitrospiria bacterium]
MAAEVHSASGAGALQLDIATPDRLLVSESVELVTAPGSEGEFGVLPGHCLFLTSLRQGSVRYQAGGKMTELQISGGFAHVANDRVIILADSVTTT